MRPRCCKVGSKYPPTWQAVPGNQSDIGWWHTCSCFVQLVLRPSVLPCSNSAHCNSTAPALLLSALLSVNHTPCLVALPCSGVLVTANLAEACQGVDVAIMLAGAPRRPGADRKEIVESNVAIYKEQAVALQAGASRNVKVGCLGR